MRLFLPVQYLYFRSEGLGFAEIGLLNAAFFGGVLLCEVPSGVFADHWGRARTLFLSALLLVASYTLFGVGHGLATFLVAGFLFGAAEAFVSGSDEALIYDSLDQLGRELEFARHYGARWAWYSYGHGLGALGTAALAFLDARWLFLLSVGTAAAAAVAAKFLVEPPLRRATARRHYLGHLREAARFTAGHREVRGLVVLAVGILSSILILFTYIQFLLRDAGFTPVGLGLAYAGFITASGAAAARAHLLAARWGTGRSLRGLGVALVLVVPALAFSHGLVPTLGFLLVMEVVFGATIPLLGEAFHVHVAGHHRATVVSLRSFCQSVAVIVGSPLFGGVADAAGYRWGVGALGAAALVLVALGWRALAGGRSGARD
jgi:MFS family permease